MLSIYNFLKVKLCYRTYWKQWLVFLTICFLVFACNGDSVNETEENENNPPNGEVHTLNYNISSHDWNNYQAPWINLSRIN